jgi:glutamate N-acetyltransferase/amino-acid N-acetyltransferase
LKLPLGFRFSSLYAGIRRLENNQERDDLGLIVSGGPASAAAVFTQNRVQASPVQLARRNLKMSRGVAGAILVNAGNANCATRTGDRVAMDCCRALAKRLLLPAARHHDDGFSPQSGLR